jgi:hypothetical protein
MAPFSLVRKMLRATIHQEMQDVFLSFSLKFNRIKRNSIDYIITETIPSIIRQENSNL